MTTRKLEKLKTMLFAFQGLSKLQMLLLSCNKISEIEHNSFVDLRNLNCI